MIDVATLTALSKLLFDGLAILIVFILYIKGNQKRDKEYEAEREEQRKRNELGRVDFPEDLTVNIPISFRLV